MVSTLFLIQFVAFYFWQLTSASNKRPVTGGFSAYMLRYKFRTRFIGGVLVLAALVGFIFTWGIASGMRGCIVGLMGVGCLSVVIDPFNYLRVQGLAAIYVCCVLLEMTI